MKIAQLFEERKAPFAFTQEEFDALPPVSPSNVSTKFKVGKVAFDQAKGLGATPNNQEVDYFGFVAEMKPSTFLKIVLNADRSEDARKFEEFIGQHSPLGSPTLYILANIDKHKAGEPLSVQIKGHEGRGRTWAFNSVNGNVPMPVHFILNGGYRARDLDEKFFEDLRSTGLIAEFDTVRDDPTPVNFGRIFWNGRTL